MNTHRSVVVRVSHGVVAVACLGLPCRLPAQPDSVGPKEQHSRVTVNRGMVKPFGSRPLLRPGLQFTGPRIQDQSNSGCLSTFTGDTGGVYPHCGDDRMDLTPGAGALHVLHANATYNCCITEIAFQLTVSGGVIRLVEHEILEGGGCDCMCCYDVEALVVDLEAGVYAVELCWQDWEEPGQRCLIQHDVAIPPVVGVCCQDISDGPIPYETCSDGAQSECAELYHPATACHDLEACCLGNDLCQDMNPFCCLDSSGVPLGPRSSCQDIVDCPAFCDAGGSYPPCPKDSFCEFPVGTCEDAGATGTCTIIPGPCPEYADPVCGCDGVTYDNECFAEAAAVSIDHWGACEPTQCAGTRNLSTPEPTYCAGVEKDIQIHLSPRAGATSYSLEDAPPAGWTVVYVSHAGSFDEVNGKVKWGPFFLDDPGFPRSVSYTAIPPNSGIEEACFEGAVSVDGFNEPICGDQCIFERCCALMQADLPQPACAACDHDCTNCTDSTCGDGIISMCEMTSYACAWKSGCHDDMAGMTRAAYVWKNGECYCYDDMTGLWHATTCPPPDSGCCGH